MAKKTWFATVSEWGRTTGKMIDGALHKATPFTYAAKSGVKMWKTGKCPKCGRGHQLVLRSMMDKNIYLLMCQGCNTVSWKHSIPTKDLTIPRCKKHGNPLPDGRKTYCYTCRSQAKDKPFTKIALIRVVRDSKLVLLKVDRRTYTFKVENDKAIDKALSLLKKSPGKALAYCKKQSAITRKFVEAQYK